MMRTRIGFGEVAAGLLTLCVACSNSSGPDDNPGGGNPPPTAPALDGPWSLRTSGTGASLRSIAWSGSAFVAVGDSGIALRSTDGESWTRQVIASGRLTKVLWTGGRFVVVGNSIATSPDGVTWTASSPAPLSASYVTRHNSGSLLACQGGSLLWSYDGGSSWTTTNAMPNNSNGAPNLLGIWSTPVGTFAIGDTWTVFNYLATFKMIGTQLDTVVFPRLLYHGLVWTGSFLYGDNNWYTTDGVTWLQKPTHGVGVGEIIWADSNVVVAGTSGSVAWSRDATTWNSRNTGVTSALLGIAFSGSRYVAVGAGGVIVTRP